MGHLPPASESVLSTARLLGVLELAARKAGWGSPLPPGRGPRPRRPPPLPPPPGRGGGGGLAGHFSFDTYVAEVAEVSVERGRVRVHKVFCAVDCGRVINPDGVKAQMEGGIVYGLSAAPTGAITVKDGRCEQSIFHDFELLRIDETPEVEVDR